MSVGHILELLPDQLAVCRLDAGAPLPEWARSGDLLAFIRTRTELSIVCREAEVPDGITVEPGWRVLKVAGPLDFSMLGVLSSIAGPLAEASVSIFVLSTYETDYILVKNNDLRAAIQALQRAGHRIHADSS